MAVSEAAASTPAAAPRPSAADITTAAAAAIAPSSVSASTTGLLDLEKELSCSICTDTLYQPLTLLDCLHTFCGSCLKLWFAWQVSQADSDPELDDDDDRLANPYTCPSCRAHVRGTRPDAKITTLLDMYLAANPGKGKSEEEKAEMREKYTPGDDVVPRLSESAEDRQMVREARRLRIREEQDRNRRGAGGSGRGGGGGYQRGIRHEPGRRAGNVSRERDVAQHLGHQHSLRSLASMEDLDPQEMEERILRQILDDGLLEGIDLENLTSSQTEELGEFIAESFSRRHGHRFRRRRDSEEREQSDSSRRRDASRRDASGQRNSSRQRSDSRRRADSAMQREGSSGQGRPGSGQPSPRLPPRSPARSPPRSPARSTGRAHSRSASEVQGPNRPHTHVPVQREDRLQAYPADPRQRRRSSDARRQTSPATSDASRSASDLSIRPSSSEQQPPRRVANRTASGTEVPAHRHALRDSPVTRSPLHSSPAHSPPQSPPATATGWGSPRTGSLTTATMAPSVVPVEHMANPHPTLASNASYHHTSQVTAPSSHGRTGSFANSMPGVSRLQGHGFPEPVIKCERCGKANIQYQVHYNCQTCKNGKYNICDRCYKAGKGCLVWYGFGRTAWRKYQQKGAPSPDLPHVLLGTRYRRPGPEELVENGNNNLAEGKLIAREPATKRRRVGAFCYTCHEYAEDFFYKCDECNEGEWGFCKNCVNQARCCTHPLLPLAWVSSNRFRSYSSDVAHGVQASFAPISDQAMIQPFPPSNTGAPRQYRPLSIQTTCDRCKISISPSQTRYHCPVCNDGTLELCAPCYAQLQDDRTVAPQDGPSGWRRCPRARHRMQVLAYQESAAGQRRVVLNDLVGGHFLLDEPDLTGNTNTGTHADNNSDNSQNHNHATTTNPPQQTQTSERRYHWNEGDKGHSRTLSRPQTGTTTTADSDPRRFRPGLTDGSSANNPPSAAPRRSRFPPDGGVGKRCWARWSWIPDDGVQDELMFPKGAEVTEVLDVTDEWCEGAYAGSKGVFPASYVRVLEVRTMEG